MKMQGWRKAVLFAMGFFFLAGLAGGAGFAHAGKRWVSVLGGMAPDGAGQGLVVSRSDGEALDVEMTTSGFFVADQEENGQSFQVLEMGRTNGDLAPGWPNLPTIRQYIHIPAGKSASVKVTPGRPVTLDGYRVHPVQPPGIDSPDAAPPEFLMNDAVYQMDASLPSELVTLDETEVIRGRKIALIRVCPFQYNPAREMLTVYPRIKVEIRFQGAAMDVGSRLSSSVFDEFINGFVLNPESIAPGGPAEEAGDLEGAEYLIITGPDFASAAESLRSHRESLGLSAVVKTTDDTGSAKTEIQTYIQNAYDSWTPPPSYVLLLGDVEAIPTTYQSTTSRGTDLYYSTVDGADITPDLFLGRISVNTLDEADVVVQKIIDYESQPTAPPSFYENALVAAYFQDYNLDGYADRRFVRTSEEVRDFLLTREKSVERVYCRTSGSTPTNYNNGAYGNGEPLPPELLAAGGFAWDGGAQDILDAIEAGVFLVLHRDHGMDRNDGYSHTGWGDPYFVETHVASLDNEGLFPVVLSINCQSGWFDGETDLNTAAAHESFAELFLRKSGGGAVGVLAASRNSYSGYNDFLAEGFIDCVWPDFLPSVPNNSGANSRLGPMLNHGKIAMDLLWGTGARQTQYELFHVFGDPALEMWTQEPVNPPTRLLAVRSTPIDGAPVSVNPDDVTGAGDGNTDFTRRYDPGELVTLTAPATHEGRLFIQWLVDGAAHAAPTIQVTMDENHIAEAVYTELHSLSVTSSPAAGALIAMSPHDVNGLGDGSTDFTRTHHQGAAVTLTAPETFDGRYFIKWEVNGAEHLVRTLQITMTEDLSAAAVFSRLASDRSVLVVDLDGDGDSGPAIRDALEAHGETTIYATAVPAPVDPALYSMAFVCLGVQPDNHELNFPEISALQAFMDGGGALYMEGGDAWSMPRETAMHAYFGIRGAHSGNGDAAEISGAPGAFTNGIAFSHQGDNQGMDRIEPSGGAPYSFVIWENQSPAYYNGVARDAGTFKTIGVSFEFGGIPGASRNE
ncbi:MAG: hypothetical protein GY859_09940, partial [Desulfobacterales bacterium]|nr:hypothetical protein [Desulfobacterales bacterium]